MTFTRARGATSITFALAVIVGTLGWTVSAAGSNEPISNDPLKFRMLYAFGTEPAVLAAILNVTPHEDNRNLRLVVESEQFYTSSDIQLDGLEAPIVHTIHLKALPAGDYCVEATLFRGSERLRSVKRPYLVIGLHSPIRPLHVSACQGDAADASMAATPMRNLPFAQEGAP